MTICEISVLREPSPGQNKKLGLWYLCFAPDGRHLATTGSDDRVRVCLDSPTLRSPFLNPHFQLWEICEKRVLSTYGMTAGVHILDISPNRRFLACASYMGIIMWRIRDGSKKIFTDSSTYAYSYIKFSPNGLYILTVDFQHTLRIWNVRTGHLIGRLTEHEPDTQKIKGLRTRYNKSQRFWTISSVDESTTAGDQPEEEENLLFTGHRVYWFLSDLGHDSYVFSARML